MTGGVSGSGFVSSASPREPEGHFLTLRSFFAFRAEAERFGDGGLLPAAGVGIRRLVELAELLFLDDATGLVGFRRCKRPRLTGDDRRVEAVLPDVFRLLLEFHAAADAPFGAADREVSGVGEDLPVVVVGRESGSGTRSAFEEILGIEDQCAYSSELDSTGAVMARVASTPGAIGYVSLDVIDDTVSVFTLEGVEANAENIKSGDYFLSRPFVMATNGEISEQNEVVQAWFDFVASDTGRAVIEEAGLINVD